ncbi:type VI secretion system contractile sheath large subunit [Enterobacter bugandensis]|nr:type VI secretion system contractile sheath large subunit [Enterobacter bugandensis]
MSPRTTCARTLRMHRNLSRAASTGTPIPPNPGFFRVKLFAVPHFQVEGMDVNLSLVSQMPKAKA